VLRRECTISEPIRLVNERSPGAGGRLSQHKGCVSCSLQGFRSFNGSHFMRLIVAAQIVVLLYVAPVIATISASGIA
jgi:hypothetical protein